MLARKRITYLRVISIFLNPSRQLNSTIKPYTPTPYTPHPTPHTLHPTPSFTNSRPTLNAIARFH
ncbi:MAG: hypothetical protein F6J93_19205 [Oscillatoria sp. SIO1A7]|nr:hypothetical protein [Oscillatoria sp. SIO1A7]